MNLLLVIISIILCFGSLVLIEKLFKKEGVYCFMVFATITANIIVCKNINIGGIVFTLANVLFSSNFLATDILSEKYSKKDAEKGVYLSLLFAIMFMIAIQIALAFIPDTGDIAQKYMKGLFALNLRTTIASVSMFFLSNVADVYLFNKIKEKTPNKLWLRNNVATITVNCLENFLFVILAFSGIYDTKLMLEIALTTCLAEVVVGLCDTPFIYLSTKWWKNDN